MTNPSDLNPDRHDDSQQRIETRELINAATQHLRDLAEKAAIERAEFHVWFQQQLKILRQGS